MILTECYGTMVSLALFIRREWALTRYNITSIHSILVLNETEAIHELDLSDFTSAMRCEVGLNIGLGGCDGVSRSVLDRSQKKERMHRRAPKMS